MFCSKWALFSKSYHNYVSLLHVDIVLSMFSQESPLSEQPGDQSTPRVLSLEALTDQQEESDLDLLSPGKLYACFSTFLLVEFAGLSVCCFYTAHKKQPKEAEALY